MNYLIFLGALCGVLSATSASGQYLWLNVSFKAVLNPTNGLRAYNFTITNIDAAIAQMNALLAGYERGYRLRRVDPLRDIGGIGDFIGPSKWFNKDPRAFYYPNGDASYSNKNQLEFEARTNAEYFWNFNAINYYIVAGYGAIPADAGDCSFPASGHEIITMGTVDNALVMLHETAHYFELYHPHGGCGCPGTDGCTLANGYWLGDDEVADTLPTQSGDFCYTTQNHVAIANFFKTYTNCTPIQQNLVDDVFFNLMAYGFNRVMDRLTPGQLDRWTDFGNVWRAHVASGKAWFVGTSGSDVFPGNSTYPFATLAKATQTANDTGGDIILLRPGNYNQRLTISKPVTLRTARTNSFPTTAKVATIGRP